MVAHIFWHAFSGDRFLEADHPTLIHASITIAGFAIGVEIINN